MLTTPDPKSVVRDWNCCWECRTPFIDTITYLYLLSFFSLPQLARSKTGGAETVGRPVCVVFVPCWFVWFIEFLFRFLSRRKPTSVVRNPNWCWDCRPPCLCWSGSVAGEIQSRWCKNDAEAVGRRLFVLHISAVEENVSQNTDLLNKSWDQ